MICEELTGVAERPEGTEGGCVSGGDCNVIELVLDTPARVAVTAIVLWVQFLAFALYLHRRRHYRAFAPFGRFDPPHWHTIVSLLRLGVVIHCIRQRTRLLCACIPMQRIVQETCHAKHLTSPAAKDDRESVYSRAKQSCPPIQDEFCKELMAVVRPAGAAAPAAPPPSAPPKK